MLERLTSKDNPQMKQLSRLLKHKKAREEEGLFVCEGARLCEDATQADISIVVAFVTAESKKNYPAIYEKIIKQAEQVYEITDRLAHWVSDTKHPQGLFVVGRKLDNSPLMATIRKDGRYLLLDQLQDPGNVGTILRTGLALGLDGIWLSSDSAELYSPKVLRASMGAVFRLPITITENMEETLDMLQKEHVTLYAATLSETAIPVSSVEFENACAVVMGNEGVGLSSQRIEQCEKNIIIPMAQGAESLNVAMAAGIFIWEMTNGR